MANAGRFDAVAWHQAVRDGSTPSFCGCCYSCGFACVRASLPMAVGAKRGGTIP